ncbi:hypothetical protein [Acuticoccus sediminis]|uniref:hypothetical protein n=1 Tax=Acuticoccus sediminis TaxID=2184697 RepID=UPI001CFEB6C4|nr:hypothetical protein [Acuticoccus sediminis]
MLPASTAISVYRDNDQTITFRLSNLSREPYDLAGGTLRASVYSDERPVYRSTLEGEDYPEYAAYAWTIDRGTTVNLAKLRNLAFRLDVIDINGKVRTYVNGPFRIVSHPSAPVVADVYEIRVSDEEATVGIIVGNSSGDAVQARADRIAAQEAAVEAQAAADAVAGAEDALALAETAVQPDRAIIAGSGMAGGGTLLNDVTLSLSAASLASLALADTAVQPGTLAAVATSGSASDLSSGTIPDARLSAAVVASLALADAAIPEARLFNAGTGLTGGGDGTVDLTFALDAATLASLALADSAIQSADLAAVATSGSASDLGAGTLPDGRLSAAVVASLALADAAIPQSRLFSAGAGLTGGGDGTADRTFALDAATIASLALADTALQPGGAATVAALVAYNSFVDASNYERLRLAWDTNVASLRAGAAGTGSNRNLIIGAHGRDAVQVLANTVALQGADNKQVNVGFGSIYPTVHGEISLGLQAYRFANLNADSWISYGTFVDGSNYTRARASWVGSDFYLTMNAGGTGVLGKLNLGVTGNNAISIGAALTTLAGAMQATGVLSNVKADPILLIQDTDTSLTTASAKLRLAESGAANAVDNYWDVHAGTGGPTNFSWMVEYNGDIKFVVAANAPTNALQVLQTGTQINTGVGFYGATPITKPEITGATDGNAALESLIAALAAVGLVTNSTT